jgi:hypothetical protein
MKVCREKRFDQSFVTLHPCPKSAFGSLVENQFNTPNLSPTIDLTCRASAQCNILAIIDHRSRSCRTWKTYSLGDISQKSSRRRLPRGASPPTSARLPLRLTLQRLYPRRRRSDRQSLAVTRWRVAAFFADHSAYVILYLSSCFAKRWSQTGRRFCLAWWGLPFQPRIQRIRLLAGQSMATCPSKRDRNRRDKSG